MVILLGLYSTRLYLVSEKCTRVVPSSPGDGGRGAFCRTAVAAAKLTVVHE